MGARVGWWAVVAAWVFVAASLLSYSPADPPGYSVVPYNHPVANWCGLVGAYLAHAMTMYLGSGAWVLLLGAGVFVFLAPWKSPFDQLALRAIGLLLFALAFAGLHALIAPAMGRLPHGGGGLVAIVSVAELTKRFGALGTGMWLLFGALIGATLAFDRWVIAAPAALLRVSAPAVGAAGTGLFGFLKRRAEARARLKPRQNDVDDDDRLQRGDKPRRARAERTAVRHAPAGRRSSDEDEDEADAPADDAAEAEVEEDDEDDEGLEAVGEEDEEEEDELPGAPQVFDPEALREKIGRLPVRFAGARKVATEDDLRDLQSPVDLSGYRFPGLDLLEDPEHNFSEKIEAFVRDQATALEEALRVYRIDGEVVSIDSGPVITLYEVRLAPGTKVSQLSAISSDLARALKAVNIRIVPNTQGRDTVGVEVPNAVKEKVRLKELMSVSEGEGASKHRLPMFLGKDAHGEPLVEDLASMPHLLIAGTTGSGKSVCINTIIMSFLYTKRPDELKLVLIDPKMVEMSQFRDIPHLMCPVVTEMAKACAILEWAVTKMDERYELLSEAGVRDIAAYNELPWEELRERFAPQNEQEEARIPRKLPYIVFIIDELADLMMTQKEVESAIVRIAQKARAVGIHLVLATQRPQANVVTGLIKSNMPGRISFKVASGMDSRIVLDQKGGELLLGQGDMLFLSPRSHKLLRAQATLVEDRETRKVVRFLREIAAPTFERKLLQLRGDGGDDESLEKGLENAQMDPLFDKAVEIVLETKRGSVSLLQRRLAIGYSRASRLIDLMGMAGIIGNHKGTVAREVVITPEEWNAMKAQAEADSRAAEESATSRPQTQRSLFETQNAAPAAPSGSARSAGLSTPVERPPFAVPDEEDEDDEAEDAAEDDTEEEEEEDEEGDEDEEWEDDEEEDDDDEEEEEEEEDEDDEDEEADDDDTEYEDEYEEEEEDEAEVVGGTEEAAEQDGAEATSADPAVTTRPLGTQQNSRG